MTTSTKPTRERSNRRGWRSLILFVCAAVTASVYLFVTAPVPLAAEAAQLGSRTVPMRAVFALLELENDAARALWTEEIVNRGTAAGLRFGERWRDPSVHEGPLPALFLRETARELEKRSLGLRVFLGSRFPINTANQLTGDQDARFAAIVETGMPQVFIEATTGMHTGMFADRASVEGCVTCHNEHADSPKTDWRLNDVMGATTWMYPEEAVSAERALELLGALRESLRATYAAYLDKAAKLPKPPAIGNRWPREGLYLPTVDAFMAEHARRTSAATVRGLLEPEWAIAAAADDALAASLVASTLRPSPPPATRALPTTELPVLIIRSKRSTHITVEHDASRVMVTRLPAGGVAALTARPPLRLRFTERSGVEVEYAGKPFKVKATGDEGEGELELSGPIAHEGP